MPNPRRHLRPTTLQQLESRITDRTIRTIGISLAFVLLLGTGAVATSGAAPDAPVRQVEALELSARVAPVPTALPSKPAAKPVAPAPRRTVKKASPAKRANPVKRAAVKRWLPTGTGMWLHEYSRSEGGNGPAVVARAKRVGLTTLYVQTGSSKKGWIGTATLRSLLPATKCSVIKVIAWDFPALKNPEADAMRMARAAAFRCGGCPRVAAVAPDIETTAEGTRISDVAVSRYYSRLRRALPPDIAILATVPWPSELRTGRYPYARTAALSDALLPMAYWYNRSPAVVTATSMSYLARFGKPVMPVGQGYDGRLDAPFIAADPNPHASVRSFLTTAERRGATHVSLWSWQTTGGPQWRALAEGTTQFRPGVAMPGSRGSTGRK